MTHVAEHRAEHHRVGQASHERRIDIDVRHRPIGVDQRCERVARGPGRTRGRRVDALRSGQRSHGRTNLGQSGREAGQLG